MSEKVNIEHEVEKLFNQFDYLMKLKDEAAKNLSETDTELSSLYHTIEGVTITHVAQSHELIKQLKAVLVKRRTVKKETMIIQSVIDSLSGHVTNAKNKRTSIVKKHNQVEAEIVSRAVTPVIGKAKEQKENKELSESESQT